jgi:hypothetical protein
MTLQLQPLYSCMSGSWTFMPFIITHFGEFGQCNLDPDTGSPWFGIKGQDQIWSLDMTVISSHLIFNYLMKILLCLMSLQFSVRPLCHSSHEFCTLFNFLCAPKRVHTVISQNTFLTQIIHLYRLSTCDIGLSRRCCRHFLETELTES